MTKSRTLGIQSFCTQAFIHARPTYRSPARHTFELKRVAAAPLLTSAQVGPAYCTTKRESPRSYRTALTDPKVERRDDGPPAALARLASMPDNLIRVGALTQAAAAPARPPPALDPDSPGSQRPICAQALAGTFSNLDHRLKRPSGSRGAPCRRRPSEFPELKARQSGDVASLGRPPRLG